MGIYAILLDSGVSLQINGGPTSTQRCIIFVTQDLIRSSQLNRLSVRGTCKIHFKNGIYALWC